MSLLKHRRDQVRVFLLDKKALDSLGNAYADEVLFEAGIHPKTFCRSLSHQDGVRLHDAIVKVMSEAVAEVARRGRADRREGARLPEGAAEGDLPALRREAPHRRRQGHGLLVLPALPAGDAARPRGLDAHRPLIP